MLTNMPDNIHLILNDFLREHDGYTIIFLHESGSKLYGTNTSNSDVDYRGIFIPSLDSLLTKTDLDYWMYKNGKDNSEKNQAGDIDLTLWSFHKFIGMIRGGDTNAFDTLFAINTPSNLYCLNTMESLFALKEHFYPKSLKSFFGYALGQVKLYSMKGDKLQSVVDARNSAEQFLQTISDKWIEIKLSDSSQLDPDKATLQDARSVLPVSDNLKWVEDDTTEYYQVLDKKFIKSIRVIEFLKRLTEIENKYGSRAKAAMENNKIDYKAMYHAFRVLHECKELMERGTITFPLKNVEFLMKIRRQEIEPTEMFRLIEEQYDEVSGFEKSDHNYLKQISDLEEPIRVDIVRGLIKKALYL